LTCPGDTKYNGADFPLNVTLVWPSLVDHGTVSACCSEAAKPDPKIETIDPGATGWPT
jgi:hypothetical protein